MKFLLDVCASSRSLRGLLERLGHNILSVVELNPSATDDEVLAIALKEDRILITEDKDFGELIFVRGLAHGTVIRFCEMSVDEQVGATQELLEKYAVALESRSIITVHPGRIRIRST